jgi:hypothetical protein
MFGNFRGRPTPRSEKYSEPLSIYDTLIAIFLNKLLYRKCSLGAQLTMLRQAFVTKRMPDGEWS